MHDPAPAEDEAHLIRGAKDRDPTAFAAIVLRHQRRIRSFLSVRLRHHHDVEDLTQEVFVTAFRKIDGLQPEGPIGPWLRRIAENLLANHRRKFRATPIGLMDEMLSSIDRRIEAFCDGDREVAALEALQQCLANVEDSSRRLLQDRYEKQTPLEELALSLGRKTSAVSMQLHRLRTALGACIAARLNPENLPTP